MRWAWVFIIGMLPMLSVDAVVPAGIVDPREYDAFWLWAAVAPQPVLSRARTLYVLKGQIEPARGEESGVRIIEQHAAVPQRNDADEWLVYRVHTLHWSPAVESIVLAQLRRARAAGGRVVGVQIDFDAHTLHLGEYLDFLREFRHKLPNDYKLSITGLLDWAGRVDSEQVNQLRGIVDEVVVQTYQGRRTIPNFADYFPRVSRLAVPFKVGLAQGGTWNPPLGLTRNPLFRGYVVFLTNKPSVARELQ
jgi:hypothetical protein